jgi:hypothetical protein
MSYDRFDWMVPTLFGGAIWVGCYYLETLLSRSGWAIQTDESWELVASGWSLLIYCWPVFVAGAIAGVLLTEFLRIRLWERTRGRLLQQHLNDAIKEKMDARRLARAELTEREMLLTRQRREVQQCEAGMDAERAEWRAYNLDMQQQLDNERDRANRAESKWRDANCVAQRHKRRVNKGEGSRNFNPSKVFNPDP